MEREAQPNRWETGAFARRRACGRRRFGRAQRSFATTDIAAHAASRLHRRAVRRRGRGLLPEPHVGAPVWFVVGARRGRSRRGAAACGDAVVQRGRALARCAGARRQRPAAGELRDWLQAYTDEHYRPEPKQRRGRRRSCRRDERSERATRFLSRWSRAREAKRERRAVAAPRRPGHPGPSAPAEEEERRPARGRADPSPPKTAAPHHGRRRRTAPGADIAAS
jgi:hypothetical protein